MLLFVIMIMFKVNLQIVLRYDMRNFNKGLHMVELM